MRDIGERVCMDCGKTFIPTFDDKGKLSGCWYWGKLNPCMKYQYNLRFLDWEERIKITKWQKWLMKILPDYYPAVFEPSVKPITARWWLHIKEWWTLFTDSVYRDLANSEMWTCHECVIEHDNDSSNQIKDDKDV